jgi:enoyl-CoA hydratase
MRAMDNLVALRVEKNVPNVAEVVLLGPGKGNAMGPQFWEECPRVFRALSADDSVRAIVVRGSGGNFTYGLDLKAMAPTLGGLVFGEGLAKDRTKLYELVHKLQESFDSIAACKKPVIAAISGKCIGGGVDMISACDVRLAQRDALFSVREVRVAMVADLGSLQRLPKIIGVGHTKMLALTGDDITAERAEAIGLVEEVYDDEAELLEAARALASRIGENPPLVVAGVKEVIDFCADKSVAEGERFVAVWNSAFLASNDLKEAFAAFMERRDPKYTGS